MKILLPELSMVLLIGVSGSGKSTFAHRHFKATEIISSDVCRGLVSDDENDQTVSSQAFEVVHFILRQRLALGRLTVIDATNLNSWERANLVAIAREYHVLPAAIVFKVPAAVCAERNAQRENRDFGPHVLRRQSMQMQRGLKGLNREGFRAVTVLRSVEEIDAVEGIERQPMWNNRKHEHGPFDVVGDVHGCNAELHSLLGDLGYTIEGDVVRHPAGRKLVFVGDLVDRGPDAPGVLRLVMASVKAGTALCVPGNHDAKLLRWLLGKKVQLTHGLDKTVEQLEADPGLDRKELSEFLDGLVSHLVLDDGKLVVAHAGIKEEMQGRGSGQIREFCLYGETTGERDEYGLPERLDWAREYRGRALVVYGHTPFATPRWLNNTVNVDTGCAFGGSLTALRYPELETISVPALETYAESARPLFDGVGGDNAQSDFDRVLDLDDLRGKRQIHTALKPSITVAEENINAAIEVMSRFAVDPRWLIYLPPTMSPCGTSQQDGWLERPEEAFAYFREHGVANVVCEEKHMGSRAGVVVCRDPQVAVDRFGLPSPRRGVIYTRTGRPFFNHGPLEQEILERLAAALEKAGLWDELATDWLCLDCELMPWSLKAKGLLQSQYAAVGASGEAHTRAARDFLSQSAGAAHLDEESQAGIAALLSSAEEKNQALQDYRKAYRHYCWEVLDIDDVRLAPFHFLAAEGVTFTQRDHLWHMAMAGRLAATESTLFPATQWREVNLDDETGVSAAIQWWEELTTAGGEGMVVKPRDFVVRGEKGIVQPAVKCRGREYLRIIYGPEYDRPENLDRLRQRNLRHKQSMAEREFALGLEGLERFIARRPLREVHQCVLAVLAMESEPVDPRL